MAVDVPSDFVDFVRCLHEEDCDFLIVGAHALAAHGISRATGDLDVFVRPSAENAARLWRALLRFGAPVAAHEVRVDDFVSPGTVYQMGLPPHRIDVITQISGVSYDDAGAVVLVVHFWAVWCEPCERSIAAHDAIAHRYAPSDVAVLAMAEDRLDRDVLAFLERHPLERLAVARDQGHETASVHRPSRMPSTFVIDRHGKTVHVLGGWRERDTEMLVREIDRVLGE